MKIKLVSVMVEDQQAALDFYTDVLGFVKKVDIPMGEHRWLTITSSEEPDGPEIVLEPVAFAPAATFQKSLYDAGIPWTAFQVDDVDSEYKRLHEKGVEFSTEPTQMGATKFAVFNDTCGNRIQIYQVL